MASSTSEWRHDEAKFKTLEKLGKIFRLKCVQVCKRHGRREHD